MMNPLNETRPAGAAYNAVAAVLLALAVNGLIALLDLGGPDAALREPSFAPPGAAIGAVWTTLFAMMGVARWAALRADDRGGPAWVTGLILLCVAYPFYTGGFDLIPSMVGNVVTLTAAAAVVLRLLRRAWPAALLVAPVVAWTAFACVLTGTTIAIN